MNRIVLIALLYSQVYSWCMLKNSASDGAITQVDYSPNRDLFATISPSGNVRVWNAINHKIITEIGDSPNSPTDIAFSYNNTVLAVAYSNGKIRFYDASSSFGEIVGFDAQLGNGNLYMDFSDDSDYLLTCGGSNSKAHVWYKTDLATPDFTIDPVDAIAC